MKTCWKCGAGLTADEIGLNYKIGVGVSFDCPTRLRGSFEVGGAFGREMRAAFGTFYKPKNAVYLKAGLLY